ncbi:hypothetical protein BDN71DRAFT_1457120 [Pleurotus eryngii]|uniref:Chromatin modification-related protein n=1 Tax=Pleurotus eryngii TaxID=5323 RepID=A0A9P6D181_PLEER|nr:hypothetical protein BDN71DRAFT_1457120 [Pleurotus eryngii]
MSVSVQNLEEAATVASEFIYSLDNLPNEVTHLLQEIKHRDARVLELQREVEKDSARYIRHQLRSSNSSNSNSNPNSTATSPAANGKTNGSSNAHLALPEKIDAAYVELNNLSDEKIALARRLVELFMRTRARLDIDLSKVRVLQGEVPEPLPSLVGLGKEETSPNVSVKVEKPAPLTDSVLRKAESMLKSAQATGIPVDRGSPTPSNGGNPTKKRKLAASASIKLPARASTPPAPAPPITTPIPRSRLSRQIHPPPVAKKLEEDEEMEGEAEEEAEEDDEEDADDERLYCFCQKRSYGDMIACDNEGKCPYEWFHLGCVGLKQPTPEKWYCSECLSKGAGTIKGSILTSSVGRKGRKK